MAKALVIVESPAKAKTINKYLGKQFIVKASLGHIKDLPKKNLAVDIEHGFEPDYQIIEGKKKLVAELKAAAQKVEEVYLAADPDREGEAICYHLQEELGDKKGGPKIFRVMFNEITKKAVQKAFEKPSQVNVNLVEAQQARRVLDRLVGYKISPLLWDKVRRGLSAGRVQKERILDHRRGSGGQEAAAADRAPHPEERRDAGSGRAGDRRPDRHESGWRRLRGEVGGDARKEAQPGCAVHHFDAATGSVAQAALQREAHHDAGAAAV